MPINLSISCAFASIHFPDFWIKLMFVWVARFSVMLSLRNFLKYCIGDNSSAAGNENSFPRKAMSRAGDLGGEGGGRIVVLNYLMNKTLLGFAVNTVTLLSKLCSVLLPLFDKVANLQFEPSLRHVCLNYLHMLFLIGNTGLSE